jgi:hypothetical protein
VKTEIISSGIIPRMLTFLSLQYPTLADQQLREDILSFIYLLGVLRSDLINLFIDGMSERYVTDLVKVLRLVDGLPLKGCLILLQSLLFTSLVNPQEIFGILKSIFHKDAFAFGVLCESFVLFLPDDNLRQQIIESGMIPHLLTQLSSTYVYQSLAMGIIDVTKRCLTDERLHSFVDYLMESGLVSFLISQTLTFFDLELRRSIDNLFKQLVKFKPQYFETFFKSVNLRKEYLKQLNPNKTNATPNATPNASPNPPLRRGRSASKK